MKLHFESTLTVLVTTLCNKIQRQNKISPRTTQPWKPSNIPRIFLSSWFSLKGQQQQPIQSWSQNNIFSHWLLLYQLIESRLSGDQRVRSGPQIPKIRSVGTRGNIPEERRRVKSTSCHCLIYHILGSRAMLSRIWSVFERVAVSDHLLVAVACVTYVCSSTRRA